MDEQSTWSFSDFLAGVTSTVQQIGTAAVSIRGSVNQIDQAVNGGQSDVVQTRAVENTQKNLIVWLAIGVGVYMLVKRA